MTARTCVVCGEDLPTWTRADKTTCGSACRNRLYRTRKASCDTFATLLRAVAPRSGAAEGREPVLDRTGLCGASGRAALRPTNPVVLALVVALRDVESRRARGKVLTDLTPKEPTP
jgi:predicted nucleic acid-binding Zn ribbon protein